MDISLPVKNNTDTMNQLFRLTFLMGGDLCDGGSETQVGTTDFSPPVRNNTNKMNQLVG